MRLVIATGARCTDAPSPPVSMRTAYTECPRRLLPSQTSSRPTVGVSMGAEPFPRPRGCVETRHGPDDEDDVFGGGGPTDQTARGVGKRASTQLAQRGHDGIRPTDSTRTRVRQRGVTTWNTRPAQRVIVTGPRPKATLEIDERRRKAAVASGFASASASVALGARRADGAAWNHW